eukprot:14362-Heterococcus_DN1.PRE.1
MRLVRRLRCCANMMIKLPRVMQRRLVESADQRGQPSTMKANQQKHCSLPHLCKAASPIVGAQRLFRFVGTIL